MSSMPAVHDMVTTCMLPVPSDTESTTTFPLRTQRRSTLLGEVRAEVITTAYLRVLEEHPVEAASTS